MDPDLLRVLLGALFILAVVAWSIAQDAKE